LIQREFLSLTFLARFVLVLSFFNLFFNILLGLPLFLLLLALRFFLLLDDPLKLFLSF
jgi:hypothetical protein